jgi:hypothetical protein
VTSLIDFLNNKVRLVNKADYDFELSDSFAFIVKSLFILTGLCVLYYIFFALMFFHYISFVSYENMYGDDFFWGPFIYLLTDGLILFLFFIIRNPNFMDKQIQFICDIVDYSFNKISNLVIIILSKVSKRIIK